MRFLQAATAAAVLALVVIVQVPALAADPGPQWQTTSDTGSLGDDIAQHVGASQTLDHVNQGLDTVFVSGTSTKSAALRAAGVNDLDVGTTAYDANTGALRWKTTYDGGVGVTDQLGAFEVNYQNNLIYEGINSGQDIVTVERSVSDGKLSRKAVYPGASVSDFGISSEGGYLGEVGQKGGNKFLVLTYETGSQNLKLEATPVDGHANSADIPHSGSLNTTRTLLVTGQSSGFGTGGDMYTVAYNYGANTPVKLWEQSWASPNNRADEGMVAAAANVSALGKGVGFIAGRTFTPERGWDIVVNAYDLATGAPIWAAPVTFDGEASKDDVPMYLTYSDKTSTLYLAGTSERGFPHGQDVVTMAFNALTGDRLATAYAAGDVSNGDDTPTGLTVSNDGLRVFVAANVLNFSSTGDRQAALFAYDSRLNSAGSRVVGGAGDDRSAGVVLNSTQTRAFLAGSTRTSSTGFDHQVSSFAVDGFTLPPVDVATHTAFTPSSASSGRYGDSATLEAKLTDASGAALAGRSITFALAGKQATAPTDGSGIARATFALDSVPGSYTATATFNGQDHYLGSSTSTPFEIQKAIPTLSFSASSATQGDYTDQATLTATLLDASGRALSGKDVALGLEGRTNTVTTDASGGASTTFVLDSTPGSYTATAHFGGDAYYVSADASSPFQIQKETSAMKLDVSGSGSRRTLTVSLFDSDSPSSGLAGRKITFYADGASIGTAQTDSAGSAKLAVPAGYRGGTHAFRAVFTGDEFFLGSEGSVSS